MLGKWCVLPWWRWNSGKNIFYMPYYIFVFLWSSNSVISCWLLNLKLSSCKFFFFYSEVFENIWVQELDVSSVNFSNFFTFAHNPQAWKYVIWYTFWTTFNLCEITWWGACLHQSKMLFSFFPKLYFLLVSSSCTHVCSCCMSSSFWWWHC